MSLGQKMVITQTKTICWIRDLSIVKYLSENSYIKGRE